MENLGQNQSIETNIEDKRSENFSKLLKQKKDYIFGLLLVFIIWIGVFIRTRNISKLKDITTGTWTLGPDLDPFLFLRWTKYIVDNGTLMINDMFRYVPLGYNTAGEMKLLAYLIAWFHKFLSFFSLTDSITYSAIIFPVIMFALTTLAFFLFAKKIFYKEEKVIQYSIALLATAFFVLIPSLLPRTIAGIPEKESAAFFFLFLAYYFFLEAYTTEKFKKGLLFGVLAGISTGLMALIWGGVLFIFLIVPAAVFFAFLLGKVKKEKIAIYASWLFTSFILMIPFSTRYAPMNLINSFTTGFSIFILAIISFGSFIIHRGWDNKISEKFKIPKELSSTIICVIAIIIFVGIIFGPQFIIGKIQNIQNNLIEPSESRFSFTVAENKQPYFESEWKGSFGPIFMNIPLFFWLFFLGSIFLFSEMMGHLKNKEILILTLGYAIFLTAIVFSRYSPSSIFNGTNSISLIFYFGGVILFLFLFFRTYLQKYKSGDFLEFRKIGFTYIFYFLVLTLVIIGARGAIRLIMVLGAIAPVAAAFLTIKVVDNYKKAKVDNKKLFWMIISIIAIVFSLFILIGNPLSILNGQGFTSWNGFYQQDLASAKSFAPGIYQWQWQNAMSWVRQNTPTDAVFAHWWDYGYWLQSLGERATILDGGNAIIYWNHLLGRHVLTGADENKALEFLYTHNATHLLIDSTDIGKYTAFSSIGADENYDRFSWIPNFFIDRSQTIEDKNETITFYTGGSLLDEDIITVQDGEEIMLPEKNAAIGAIIIKTNDKKEFSQPEMIIIYSNKQYTLKIRYLYIDSTQELIDFKSGVEAGAFIYPSVNSVTSSNIDLDYFGAALYLSKRTINSQLAKLYLFNQETSHFKLVHTEEDLILENLKQQKWESQGNFVYYQGIRGPIKIWEINYPSGIESNPEFLERQFPNQELFLAQPGKY